ANRQGAQRARNRAVPEPGRTLDPVFETTTTPARVSAHRAPLAPFAAAAAGGVLYFLGYIGWGVWPCLLVFLVPLWWGLEELHMRRPSASFSAGLIFGLTAYAGGFLWLWYLVDPFLDGNRL